MITINSNNKEKMSNHDLNILELWDIIKTTNLQICGVEDGA
jgi:hypothetical protein